MIYKCKHKNSSVLKRVLMTMIILLFLVLPVTTSISSTSLHCITVIEGRKFLQYDLDIECGVGDHHVFASFISSIIIAVLVVGMPLLAFVHLIKIRHDLETKENLETSGFLYIGLKPQTFYWEILLHFRKVLLIMLNVFLSAESPEFRALLGLLIMIIYLEVVQKVRPYQIDVMNRMEFKANLAGFFTFYVGLLFVQESPMHSAIQWVLFGVMAALNAEFIIYALKQIFAKQFNYMISFFKKHVLCIERKKKRHHVKKQPMMKNQEEFNSFNEKSGEMSKGYSSQRDYSIDQSNNND